MGFGGSSSYSRTTEGLTMMENGDETHVQQAKDLLAEFQENIEVVQHQWETHLIGAFPNVPAYIAGVPETMWSREEIRSDRSPLRIWIGLTSSAGVREASLVKRGCTLAAFAIAMSGKRPVYLTPYVNLGRHGVSRDNALISWDISTSPLVLSELMACTSRPEVTRYVGIEACELLNPNTNGAWHRDYDNEDKMRENLGAKPDDMYLSSIHLYDPMLTDPIGWLKTNIEKYGNEDGNS